MCLCKILSHFHSQHRLPLLLGLTMSHKGRALRNQRTKQWTTCRWKTTFNVQILTSSSLTSMISLEKTTLRLLIANLKLKALILSRVWLDGRVKQPGQPEGKSINRWPLRLDLMWCMLTILATCRQIVSRPRSEMSFPNLTRVCR